MDIDLKKYLANLDTDVDTKRFVGNRILDFDKVEKELLDIIKLLRVAKKDTIQTYQTTPNYSILYPTDLILDYLNDIKNILQQ